MAAFVKALDNQPRDLTGHRRSSVVDIRQGFKDSSWGDRLDQISARAPLQRGKDAICVVVYRQDDDFDFGVLEVQFGNQIKARFSGKLKVQKHHFRRLNGNTLQRRFSRTVRAHAVKANRAADERLQVFAELVVVLDKDDSNAVLFHNVLPASLVRTRMATFAPPPGLLSILNSPPTDSIRDFMFTRPFPSARGRVASNPIPLSSMES